jgi:hypothetical protein
VTFATIVSMSDGCMMLQLDIRASQQVAFYKSSEDNLIFTVPTVLDHLVIQRMDTSGRTVLGSGTGAGAAKQMFGKDEMAAILRCVTGTLFL